ncbi:MAG: translation initiation factor IF-2 subunit gamma [Desulfurococcaceae archaeon]|nr:translation initiation factor IF-2 subunit gamma [Desulfurococcaceae archaeon]
MPIKIKPPEVNIGVVGHVDHGKTTLVQALTGIWTARHSKEIERGMTIFLGYADGNIATCPSLNPPDSYTTELVCPDGSEAHLIRRVSYVDAPGHEAYMTTMLSGAMIVDGAILVVAANEPCPQPQTIEHLTALEILGVKNIVIVQNKVDVVSKEKALKNYEEIKNFIKGTIAENAPIIPISALHKVNIDVLLQAIQEVIPTPQRDYSKPPLMYVVRSFDINRPGTPHHMIQGGVVGGTLLQGKLRQGQEIVILPGVKVPRETGKTKTYSYEPVVTTIEEIRYGDLEVEEATPSGLIAIRTNLDPSLTKADQLVGSLITIPGNKIPVTTSIEITYHELERVVGVRGQPTKLPPLQVNEKVIVAVGAATRIASIKSLRKDRVELKLEEPVATWKGSRVALGRRVMARWRLAGWGIIENIYE